MDNGARVTLKFIDGEKKQFIWYPKNHPKREENNCMSVLMKEHEIEVKFSENDKINFMKSHLIYHRMEIF